MRYHICGGGAIGSLLGWHIRRIIAGSATDDALSIIIRPYQLRQLRYPRSPSITLRNPLGGHRIVGGFQVEVLDETHQAGQDIAILRATRDVSPTDTITHPTYGHIQSLFITTKAHHAPLALESLVRTRRISPATTIVLLTNGMGIYEHLVDTFFPDPSTRPQFVLATNTHGAFANGMFDVSHAASGQIHYGVVPDPCGRDHHLARTPAYPTQPDAPFYSLHRTLSMLAALAPHLSTTHESIPETHHRLVLKLVVNSCINPLSAIHNCKNGALLHKDEAKATIRRICEEAAAILQRKAAEDQANSDIVSLPDPTDESPSSLNGTPSINRLPFVRTMTAGDLEREVVRVAKLTAGNYSSMLMDVRAKKKTEIEYINGYLSRLGRTYGVETPENDRVADLIRQMEPKRPPPAHS